MVRVDTLFLNPRLDIGAVVRRQILEGVQAVVFLNKKMQLDGKINLQVFDRRQGEANVRFDGSCCPTGIPYFITYIFNLIL